MCAPASRTLPDPTVQRTLSIGYQCEHDGRVASLPSWTTGLAPPQRPSRTARKPAAASKDEAVGHQQTPVAGGDAERAEELGRAMLANADQASRRAADLRRASERELDAKLKPRASTIAAIILTRHLVKSQGVSQRPIVGRSARFEKSSRRSGSSSLRRWRPPVVGARFFSGRDRHPWWLPILRPVWLHAEA